MAIRETFDRIANSIDRAAGSLSSLNDQVDRAAGTEFTTAPASFLPAPPPAAPGTPGNPITGPYPLPSPPGTIFDAFGQPINRTGSRSTSSGGGGASGSQFTLDENVLIPSMTPGAPLMRRSDLDGFTARGICDIMRLPSGGHVVSCPWGLYPGTDGVLSSASGSSGRSADGGGGGELSGGSPSSRSRNGLPSYGIVDVSTPTYGNVDVSKRAGSSSASSASSVSLDSRPITERLDGLRSDVQQMTRALAGDGGASIRFKGGL